VASDPSTAQPTPPKRPLSLGVIFLTLYIDLIGFSIIFPLGPDLLAYYLKHEGSSGIMGALLANLGAFAHSIGRDDAYTAVLFGGVISSVFSILQFVFAPFWGSMSDRNGRRPILLRTVAGTALGYLLWAVSGSFWMFLASRVVSGAFSGNLSVATAAVADVTTRKERSKAMGIIGAAFGLGLTTGPMIGLLAARWNPLQNHPSLERYGINPFSFPAALSFVVCVLNLVWISRRFKETLSDDARKEAREPRIRNPISAILSLENPSVRQANIVAFVFSMAFVAMESSVTFLAADRFHYNATGNGMLLGFLGVCSIITQGLIVRMLLKKADEIHVLKGGLISSAIGLALVGLAPHPWVLYVGLAFLAVGSGLVNPSTSGLISLYSSQAEQGRVLGIFRSLGSLSRAITPIAAGIVYFTCGSSTVFVGGAAISLAALGLSAALPKPVK
jgi:MFS family permease